jgi:ABC-2 type transport system ATP-binding protein
MTFRMTHDRSMATHTQEGENYFAHAEELPPIVASGLSRSFANRQVIRDASLRLGRGQCLSLIGPNGAGKSTLLGLLQGRISPDGGGVRIFGHLPRSAAAQARCGIVLQGTDFPQQLTPREILAFAAAHHPDPVPLSDLTVDFGLEALLDRRIVGFSDGEQRRLALALGFVGRPDLVFLDEPTAGLDAQARAQLHRVLRRFRDKGGSLVMASHHWDEIEALSDRLMVLHRGRVLRDGPREEVMRSLSRRQIRFRLPLGTPPPDWLDPSQDLGFAGWVGHSADADSLLRRLVAEAVPFRDLEIGAPDLSALLDQIAAQESAP